MTALVREHDRPRYYSTLFAPASIRPDLFAIYGFAVEIARVPDQVREPRLGEIRLKWWSDALVRTLGGEPGETPSLRAVAGAITRLALPIAPFLALIEARSADLYSDPPATFADLEGQMGETESVLFQMTAIALGASGPGTAEGSGHAGVAYGVARRLSAFASDRARGRTILPTSLLDGHGVTAQALFADAATSTLDAVLLDAVRFARTHLDRANATSAGIEAEARTALLPLAVVAPLLDRVSSRGAGMLKSDAGLSNLESLIRIAWASLGR